MELLHCPVLECNSPCGLSKTLTLPRLWLQSQLGMNRLVSSVVNECGGVFSPQDLADLVIRKWLMLIYPEHLFLNMKRQRGER